MQPVRGRTAGRGRPALVTGVFLLVSSLALLVPPPASPDSPSTFSSSRLADVLVQGRGAATAVAPSAAGRWPPCRSWRDNGWAMAAVADRGRGIPREELDRVFEKFHRVEDPMTMTTGGTGLGLYIARELTRAMGGEIEATSAPPGLDIHRPPADRPPGPTPPRTPPGPAATGPTTAHPR